MRCPCNRYTRNNIMPMDSFIMQSMYIKNHYAINIYIKDITPLKLRKKM